MAAHVESRASEHLGSQAIRTPAETQPTIQVAERATACRVVSSAVRPRPPTVITYQVGPPRVRPRSFPGASVSYLGAARTITPSRLPPTSPAITSSPIFYVMSTDLELYSGRKTAACVVHPRRWCSREGLFHRLRDGDAVQPDGGGGAIAGRWRLLFPPLGAPACSPDWLGNASPAGAACRGGYRAGTAPARPGTAASW